jgi:glycosyltransferase involved in cell wall biosynthesis
MPFEPGPYVLITPARNEQDFIEGVILSVIAQSLPPREWIIVSDGSTDLTDEIVRRYSRQHTFIKLLRIEGGRTRNFSAKVTAFRAGMSNLSIDAYHFIGNLDADVTFRSDYFVRLLEQFSAQSRLGIAGGLILERIGREFHPQRIHRNSVAGAVQMFRRRCFTEIGGYIPIPGGGVDAAAEITARMHGWRVQTIPSLTVFHHRRVVTGTSNVFRTRLRQGRNHHSLGYHPLFQVLSSLYQITERPYIVGSMLVMAGYVWGRFRDRGSVLDEDVVRFLQREQLRRIISLPRELRARADAGVGALSCAACKSPGVDERLNAR